VLGEAFPFPVPCLTPPASLLHPLRSSSSVLRTKTFLPRSWWDTFEARSCQGFHCLTSTCLVPVITKGLRTQKMYMWSIVSFLPCCLLSFIQLQRSETQTAQQPTHHGSLFLILERPDRTPRPSHFHASLHQGCTAVVSNKTEKDKKKHRERNTPRPRLTGRSWPPFPLVSRPPASMLPHGGKTEKEPEFESRDGGQHKVLCQHQGKACLPACLPATAVVLKLFLPSSKNIFSAQVALFLSFFLSLAQHILAFCTTFS